MMRQQAGNSLVQNTPPMITRHSNPMGQIQKLQIVSLGSNSTTTNNNQSVNSNAAPPAIYKIKRSQIIAANN